MRARVKAGVRYLLVPHTAQPGGVTSFVLSVTSTDEIRLSPPLAPWKKLAAPIVAWPLGARASDGTRAADWRNAPQLSLVNTSGAPCSVVVVLACGRSSAIAGGVPLQLLQLQVSHNSTSGNRRYVDRLTRSVVLQSRRAAAYEGGAFSFVTMALQLGAFERTRLIALGPSPRAELSGSAHAEAELQIALYCEDDCIDVAELPAEWHGQTWTASPAELDKDGTCELEVRAREGVAAPAAAVVIAELISDGRAASDGSGVTISLRARDGGALMPGGVLLFRDYGVSDEKQRKFTRAGTKLGERWYARQNGTMVYFFDTAEVDALFAACGFEPVPPRADGSGGGGGSASFDKLLTVNRKTGARLWRVWVSARYRKPAERNF